MKLYSYYEDCGRMGSIEGMFFLTDEEKARYIEHTGYLWWDELLGKHSEGYFNFSDETLEHIELPEDVNKILYEKIGQVISGPFDFEYLEEQIEEQIELDREDE